MTLRVVNGAEEAWLDLITDVDMTMRLFQNDVDAGLTEAQKEARVAANFTEATFTGYAAISMTTAWTTTPGDPAVATRAPNVYTSSANQAAQTIRGYYVTRNSDGALQWYEYFAGPIIVSLLNDAITVTPTLTLDDREPAPVEKIVAEQVLTTSGATLTADADTDMTIVNFPEIAGHRYRAELDARYNMTVAGGQWAVECFYNGVKIGEFAYITTDAAENWYFTGGCEWTAAATASTSDIVVRANEVAGGASFQMTGATTVPRRLKIVDLGVWP